MRSPSDLQGERNIGHTLMDDSDLTSERGP